MKRCTIHFNEGSYFPLLASVTIPEELCIYVSDEDWEKWMSHLQQDAIWTKRWREQDGVLWERVRVNK